MSSHREAPETSKDPVADSTDVYAFVSPDAPDTVTLIANYIPLQAPAAGPNFYEFGNDVLYEIYVDNNSDARPEITYQFRFTTKYQNPDTFLYNTGPISSNTSPNWNSQQTYSVTKLSATGVPTVLASGLTCPPCNIGPHSTPDYVKKLAEPAVHSLPSGEKVFAGQRREGFYVDLGSVFDLADLRPFEQLHINPVASAGLPGVDSTKNVNVHSIAIQIPKTMLTSDGSAPTDATSRKSVLGVWTAASGKLSGFAKKALPGYGMSVRSRRYLGWDSRSSMRPSSLSALKTSGTRTSRSAIPSMCSSTNIPKSQSFCPSSIPACSRIWRD